MAGLTIDTLERPGGVEEDPATCLHCQLALKMEELSKLARYQTTVDGVAGTNGDRIVHDIMLATAEFIASCSPLPSKIMEVAGQACSTLIRSTIDAHQIFRKAGKFGTPPEETTQ